MIGFKTLVPATVVTATPDGDRVVCSECGGINAMASVAAKIDCSTCDTTGWDNPYQYHDIKVSYRPGAVTRWDKQAGSLVYFGECSIKADKRYAGILHDVKWIEMNGIKWNPSVLREPGRAFGQHRIVLALSRKE